ncbi:ankyrin repeat and protein kinase domain-containing protein 1 [Engraulis encrasicolus]|uniref:ankyrin repeat and protein kinase domain-containing protein 1 n=1 Tax=Engraulis encrasicolus TaxID=184585 RepID=UPI002FD356B5
MESGGGGGGGVGAGEGLEKFRYFCRDDFEGDWAKVSERSSGRVYRVKLKLWRERCALKCLSSTSCYRELVEEASRLGKVKFNYVTSVYGVCKEPPALVMEFMSKGSLDALLSSHTLMWPKKFQMAHEVVMGMNFLHSMEPPLLHLNLKPANILLDGHLHVKVSDFGLVRWNGCSGTSFMEHLTARGNINYIPPETFSPNPEPPMTKFDVYSFAIVLWEILTQKKPYAGANMTEVIIRVSSGKRPSVERIPDDRPLECKDMLDIMQLCWRPRPTERPAFSDIITQTEILSEVLRLPEIRPKEQATTIKYTEVMPTSPKSPDVPLADDGSQGDDDNGALYFLSKRQFDKFRGSVCREHVSMSFKEDNSLLHYAVASADVDSVRSVLGLGADVNTQSRRGYTPLIVAVLQRLHDICSLLIEHNADVTLGDEDGWTALHFAAQNGDERSARLLLEHGAREDAADKDDWTPLHLAAQNGHEGVTRVLLARIPLSATANSTTATTTSATVDTQERQHGRTPLHLAAAYGHLGIAQLLLGKKADPSLPDLTRSSPLHLAVEEGRVRMVRLLVERGAQVGASDGRGHTPLHLAALRGHTGICRYLLGRDDGVGVNARTDQGWTPLHLAARRGHADTLLALEAQGAGLDVRGAESWTALHLACHHSQEEVVTRLLAAGADPNLAEDASWTPLHLAARSGSFPSVLQLLSRHADVNARNNAQATPLHMAAQSGSASIVRALLLNSADCSARDTRGHTPAHIARTSGHTEAAKLLAKDGDG